MSFEKNEEKRHFHRIFYNTEAILEGNGERFLCKLIDISLKGCLLDFKQPWTGSAETLYTLTINLSEEISIVMEVNAVHADATQCGFKCLHIDIDSICRLRRLVELNLGDSDLLERELVALSDSSKYNPDNR